MHRIQDLTLSGATAVQIYNKLYATCLNIRPRTLETSLLFNGYRRPFLLAQNRPLSSIYDFVPMLAITGVLAPLPYFQTLATQALFYFDHKYEPSPPTYELQRILLFKYNVGLTKHDTKRNILWTGRMWIRNVIFNGESYA